MLDQASSRCRTQGPQVGGGVVSDPADHRITVRFQIFNGPDADLFSDIKVGILQTLDTEIKGSRWHVWGESMGRRYDGYGDTQDEAALSWLADRLQVSG
jgi:hypothetical protein